MVDVYSTTKGLKIYILYSANNHTKTSRISISFSLLDDNDSWTRVQVLERRVTSSYPALRCLIDRNEIYRHDKVETNTTRSSLVLQNLTYSFRFKPTLDVTQPSSRRWLHTKARAGRFIPHRSTVKIRPSAVQSSSSL